MKTKLRYLLIIPLIIFISSLCYSYNDINVIGKTPYAYERLTVTNAATVRLDATYRDASGAVFMTVEDNNIRYRIDGGVPTIVEGHLVVAAAYQNIWLTDPHSIRNFRMIATGGDATVLVTYYRRN